MQIKYDFYCYHYDRNFVQQFMDFSQPLITAVNRPAVEISIKVMGLFGLIYASDKATFHTPFMELGHSPEGCSSFMFPRIMGPAKVHWLASNFCWKLCITWIKEHISSYCHNLWNYTTNSSPSLVQWNVAFWMQTDSSWSKRLWIGYGWFPPWQVHRRSSELSTSNSQATPFPEVENWIVEFHSRVPSTMELL